MTTSRSCKAVGHEADPHRLEPRFECLVRRETLGGVKGGSLRQNRFRIRARNISARQAAHYRSALRRSSVAV